MNDDVVNFVIRIMNQGLLVTLVISAPPILISLAIGLIVSLFQAVTQIQEQNLALVPKLVIIFGSLAVFGPWIGSIMIRFTQMCFEGFASVVF